MKTVIMAGGKGTRISSLFADLPKPMIPIAGKPVLEHEICCLKEQGFTDIILTVSHLADHIIRYLGDGSRWGVHIEYFKEEQPLGNAGALLKMRSKLTDDFLLLNADAVFNIDFHRLLRFHRQKGAWVTLAAHANDHPYDSGLLLVDEQGAVKQWLTKEDVRPQWYRNLVNAGLHVVNPTVLDQANIDVNTLGSEMNGVRVKVDLDRQILQPLCPSGKVFCYNTPEYIKDMGTPQRYEDVCADFAANRVQSRNLLHKQKAVFLDRDGTINKYVGFLTDINQFELLAGAAQAIKKFNQAGFLVIVVTNQPVVARGEVTEPQLQMIHNKMETLLGQEGAYVDAIYVCPHHPDKGYPGEVVSLKKECTCRKPKPGLLLQAAADLNVDLAASWMIGDSEKDIQAGQAAGCQTVLIGCADYKQTMTAPSILEAAAQILQ